MIILHPGLSNLTQKTMAYYRFPDLGMTIAHYQWCETQLGSSLHLIRQPWSNGCKTMEVLFHDTHHFFTWPNSNKRRKTNTQTLYNMKYEFKGFIFESGKVFVCFFPQSHWLVVDDCIQGRVAVWSQSSWDNWEAPHRSAKHGVTTRNDIMVWKTPALGM